jgi:hypothetical protein
MSPEMTDVRLRQPRRLPSAVRRQPRLPPDALHDDFARFRFLLGIADGQGVFTPNEP